MSAPMEISIERIVDLVAAEIGLPSTAFLCRSRRQPVARYRQVVMYLAREYTTKSFPNIARSLQLKDHTTVLHGFRRISGLREIDPELNAEIEALRRKITLHQDALRTSIPLSFEAFGNDLRISTQAPKPQRAAPNIKRAAPKISPPPIPRKFKMRRCLGADCGVVFESYSFGQRICDRCRGLESRAGIDPRFEGVAA